MKKATPLGKRAKEKGKSPPHSEEAVAKRGRRATASSSSVSDSSANNQAGSSQVAETGGRNGTSVTWLEVYERNGATESIPRMQEFLQERDIEVDPPVIFDWHHTGRLLRSMRQYDGMPNAVPRPAFLQGVNVQQLDADDALHTAIVQFVSRTAVGLPPQNMHGTVGLRCTGRQYGQVCGEVATLRTEEYFVNLAQQFPAAFPIGTVYTPKARSNALEIVSFAAAAANQAPLWN